MDYLSWLLSALLDVAIGAFLVWGSIQSLKSGQDIPAAVGFFVAAFLAVRLANEPNFRRPIHEGN